jgi:hypothetical protein
MDRNVAASFTLSVLTVLAFAVVLYEPEPPRVSPAPPTAPVPAQTRKEPGPVEVIEARDPDALAAVPATPVPGMARSEVGETLAGTRAILPLPGASRAAPEPPRVAKEVSRARLVSRQSVTPRPDVRPTSAVPRAAQAATAAVPPPQEPRGAFTRVRAGETLVAIAARVYGNEDEAERLWMANRDLLEREDAPLHEGALLRTP